MNADAILQVFARHQVDSILIGGMNFLLRHQPVLTYDVDLWVKDSDENLILVASALQELGAAWGPNDNSWKPVPKESGWLKQQAVFCLTSKHGAIDIFRDVAGLEGQYDEARARAELRQTTTSIPYLSLSDRDMLACQMVLPEKDRRLDRVAYLRTLLE